MRRLVPLGLICLSSLALAEHIPSPKEFFGHDVCDDYWLANYQQLTAYWKELARVSNRITVESIGKTEDGREQYMCIVTDPSNRRNLEGYRKASERLARAKDFKSDEDARNFAKKQKTVVWIDGGLHATEVLVAQQLIEQAYRMVSRNDDENNRILRDNITLLAHANPDGNDWIADWYMRRPVPEQRSVAGLPFLYQKYIGHDNNRDFYANNMAETKNINRILYNVWYPQIVYNHHQSAPAGTIMFIPPFRNPFNYHLDPIAQINTDLVGTQIHQRLIAEGKPGTAMRNSTLYSNWWNGGLRTTAYFHNMTGILSETFGSPNPTKVPFVTKFQIPTTDVPFPVDAGLWHLRQSLEYEISANYAILDNASRYHETMLFNTYRMAKNSIERGSKDNWTRYPARITELGADALVKKDLRDARMYIIPSEQLDFSTACKFVEKLMQAGVEAQRLTKAEGQWPVGSLVVRCDQAFRPHVLDMFEPQDHPNDFQYAGGPPIPPYDSAGYTLAFQMGVKFDRVLDPVALSTEPLNAAPRPIAPRLKGEYEELSLAKTANDSYLGANLALKLGLAIADAGDHFAVRGTSDSLKTLANSSSSWAGLEERNRGAGSAEFAKLVPVRKPRLALWDRYGGSMASGWTRWVLEQFKFDFDVVFAPDLDAGNLNSKYDAIIFPDGGIPARVGGDEGSAGGETGEQPWEVVAQAQIKPEDDPTIAQKYRDRIGSISAKTLANLKTFAEGGGHILAIGSSAQNLIKPLKLPVQDALVDRQLAKLANTKFYIPGSILNIKLNSGPLTQGIGETLDVMFDNSPSFFVEKEFEVGFYESEKALRSGWAWGQQLLKNSSAVADIPLGKGRVVLFGPEILFRGQSHAAFKLMFNAIFRSAMK
ncbi:MAG: peptidase [Armatimonadetes bacterium]|nr:peptidase [Armatimonadota bacterium]